jgi:hypothetical protein
MHTVSTARADGSEQNFCFGSPFRRSAVGGGGAGGAQRPSISHIQLFMSGGVCWRVCFVWISISPVASLSLWQRRGRSRLLPDAGNRWIQMGIGAPRSSLVVIYTQIHSALLNLSARCAHREFLSPSAPHYWEYETPRDCRSRNHLSVSLFIYIVAYSLARRHSIC